MYIFQHQLKSVRHFSFSNTFYSNQKKVRIQQDFLKETNLSTLSGVFPAKPVISWLAVI